MVKNTLAAVLALSAILIVSGCLGGSSSVPTDSTENENDVGTEDNSTSPGDETGDTGGGTEEENMPPKAVFKADSFTYTVGDKAKFDASASYDPDGEIKDYTWDFDSSDGIGMDARGKVVYHTFTAEGSFTVTLVVEDDSGATSTAQKTINVTSGAASGEKAVNIECDEGNSGTLSVPLNPLADSDKKHHWDMPENAVRVMVILEWTEDNWDLELDTGTGECPDNGEALASATGSDGTIKVIYSAPDGFLPTGQWFAHIAILNPDQHTPVVDTCDYKLIVTVYLLE